jgi:hypothetical protein
LVFYRTGTTVAGLNYGGSGSSSAGILGYTWNNLYATWNWNSGLMPPTGQWSFVALVVQPTMVVFYLATTNGWQMATNTLPHPNQAFSGTGTIGTDAFSASARSFNGVMDEVAVFNYSLTATQLQQIYANGARLSSVQLGFQNAGANFHLTWPQGILSQATNLIGPWTRIITSPSPFTITPTNQAGFYRIQLQ